MLKNLKEFHYPQKVSEAITLLDKLGSRGAVIAGGTTISRMVNPNLEALVDISKLGLSYVRRNKNEIRVGALTTFQEMANSSLLKEFAGGLVAKAASLVSTRLIRNVGTMGGDIVLAYPYNDMPTVLLALDASAVIASKRGERLVPFTRVMEEHPWRFIGKRLLLTEVRFPLKMSDWGSSYQRFARSFSEWEASVIIAVTVERKNDRCHAARIAVGAVTRRAARYPEAEKIICGGDFSRALCAEASKKVAGQLDPMTDWRSSKEYRRDLTRTLVARALEEAYESPGKR